MRHLSFIFGTFRASIHAGDSFLMLKKLKFVKLIKYFALFNLILIINVYPVDYEYDEETGQLRYKGSRLFFNLDVIDDLTFKIYNRTQTVEATDPSGIKVMWLSTEHEAELNGIFPIVYERQRSLLIDDAHKDEIYGTARMYKSDIKDDELDLYYSMFKDRYLDVLMKFTNIKGQIYTAKRASKLLIAIPIKIKKVELSVIAGGGYEERVLAYHIYSADLDTNLKFEDLLDYSQNQKGFKFTPEVEKVIYDIYKVRINNEMIKQYNLKYFGIGFEYGYNKLRLVAGFGGPKVIDAIKLESRLGTKNFNIALDIDYETLGFRAKDFFTEKEIKEIFNEDQDNVDLFDYLFSQGRINLSVNLLSDGGTGLKLNIPIEYYPIFINAVPQLEVVLFNKFHFLGGFRMRGVWIPPIQNEYISYTDKVKKNEVKWASEFLFGFAYTDNVGNMGYSLGAKTLFNNNGDFKNPDFGNLNTVLLSFALRDNRSKLFWLLDLGSVRTVFNGKTQQEGFVLTNVGMGF